MAQTYDIHFQLVPPGEQDGGKLYTFGYVSAVGVKGPQKLINRWLKCFTTPKGSDPFDPESGTGFSNLIGSNISNDQDFVDAMALCIEDCNAQMLAMDRRNFPPDNERLLSATLAKTTALGDDGFAAYVNIRNVAGETYAVLLPTIATRA
jgi:hypothetical protein